MGTQEIFLEKVSECRKLSHSAENCRTVPKMNLSLSLYIAEHTRLVPKIEELSAANQNRVSPESEWQNIFLRKSAQMIASDGENWLIFSVDLSFGTSTDFLVSGVTFRFNIGCLWTSNLIARSINAPHTWNFLELGWHSDDCKTSWWFVNESWLFNAGPPCRVLKVYLTNYLSRTEFILNEQTLFTACLASARSVEEASTAGTVIFCIVALPYQDAHSIPQSRFLLECFWEKLRFSTS